MVLEQHNLKFI